MAEIIDTKTDEATGREYYLYDSGLEKWKDNGRVKSPLPAHAITPETAREMRERGKLKGLISQLRGLARATGLELPPNADLEQILAGAGDTLEALTVHFVKTFLKSENVRGLAEGYKQLAAPLVGDRPEAEKVNNTTNVFVMPEIVARFLEDVHKRMKEQSEPILEGQEVKAWQDFSHGSMDKE